MKETPARSNYGEYEMKDIVRGGSDTGNIVDELLSKEEKALLLDFPEAEELSFIHEINLSFGNLLREKRRACRLTQDALSNKTGISKSTIAKIESGGIPGGPRVATIAKLLLYCNQKLVPQSIALRPFLQVFVNSEAATESGRDGSNAPLHIVCDADSSAAEGGLSRIPDKPNRNDKTSRPDSQQGKRAPG